MSRTMKVCVLLLLRCLRPRTVVLFRGFLGPSFRTRRRPAAAPLRYCASRGEGSGFVLAGGIAVLLPVMLVCCVFVCSCG